MRNLLSRCPFPLHLATPGYHARIAAAGLWTGAITILLLPPLAGLVKYVWTTELHSHVPLIPLIFGYLLFIRRESLDRRYVESPGSAIMATVLGAFALVAAGNPTLPPDDRSTFLAVGYLGLFFAGILLWLGGAWARTAAFPLGFLVFMIPLPGSLEIWLKGLSQVGSAEAAHLMFWVTGLPFVREGMTFTLQNIALTVGPECSGIRSTWVLFITSLFVGSLCLRHPGHRALLAAFVIPLGLLRNGFRIMIIGDLSVGMGPHMIDSAIHRQGGPVFFALSLVPLGAMAFWLWSCENSSKRRRPVRRATTIPT